MTQSSDPSEGSQPDTSVARYEPQPELRPRWASGLAAPQATPENWFEPDTSPTAETARGSRLSGRGLAGVLMASSILGSILGGGGMYLALREFGALDAPPVSPAPAATAAIVVRPEYSTIVQAAQRVMPSVVLIETSGPLGQGIGSGVVYDTAGWILTNKHVASNTSRIDVNLSDGRRYTADVYGLDTLTDLAILRIKGATGLTAAQMGDSTNLQVGQLAIAFGSPLGADFPNSVTTGIVSALGRDITVGSDTGTATNLHGLIQTDAAINPGNSGGPLVDASGKVIGVTTAVAASAQGIGFAIPIDIAKPIMQQALAGEPLSRPFMGITYVPIDRGVATRYKLPLDHGAWIHREDPNGRSIPAILTDGPADQAGIQTGDIVTAIEGYRIDSTHLLEDILVRYAPGRTVSVEIYRGGQYLTFRVTLGTRPATAG
jgi:S1-C subfamily serine protease